MKISKKNKAGAMAILKLMSLYSLVVFCDFSKIDSQLLTQLRIKTTSQNICIKVFPNSLLRTTMKSLRYAKDLRAKITGQLMHVYGEELTSISQLLKEFDHTNKIKFAIQNNQLIEKEEFIRIASLPTKPELTAKLYLVLSLFVVKFLTILRSINQQNKNKIGGCVQAKDELLKQIESMSVTELNDLIEALANRFNISNSLANLNPNVSSNSQKPSVNPDSKEFKVILTAVGNNRLNVIKTIREVSGLGLKESKSIVEDLPKLIKKDLNKMQAEEIKTKIEAVGAKANVE